MKSRDFLQFLFERGLKTGNEDEERGLEKTECRQIPCEKVANYSAKLY